MLLLNVRFGTGASPRSNRPGKDLDIGLQPLASLSGSGKKRCLAVPEKIIDLALMPLPVDSNDVSCVELTREKLFAIVGENHPLHKEKQITLQQLSGAPFLILKDGHCFRDDTLSAFRADNVEPRIVFESGCFLTILNMVRAGIAISVMPEMAFEPTPGCKFIPIKAERAIRTIGLVQPKQQYQTHYLRAQILLSLYLRILFQPLCYRSLPDNYPIQTFVSGLAWVSDCWLLAGLGRKHIHGHLRQALTRSEKRTRRHHCGRIYFRTQQVDFFPRSQRLTFE